MFLIKKWGILIKKESESLIVTGLEIPRVYIHLKEVNKSHSLVFLLQKNRKQMQASFHDQTLKVVCGAFFVIRNR